MNHAKQVSVALLMYADDNDDLLPYAKSGGRVAAVTRQYTQEPEVWKTLNAAHPGIFDFNLCVGGARLSEIPHGSIVPLVYDPVGRHSAKDRLPTATFLSSFVDTHVRKLSLAEWAKEAPYLSLELDRHGKPLD